MAYFSGNAIYVRPTHNYNFEICGSITIRSNTFINNIGMKHHHGGAIAAVCRLVSSAKHQDYL